jgi:hypothetical protein
MTTAENDDKNPPKKAAKVPGHGITLVILALVRGLSLNPQGMAT